MHYLRGCTMDNREGFLREELSRVGVTLSNARCTELEGLRGFY